MLKEDEEVTKATFATTVVEMMTMTIVAKAKTQVGDDIPMTRISPASYTEGDTVQKIVIHSNGKLANSSHLAAISNNETRTAITSPISTIASLSTIESHWPVCQQHSDCSCQRLRHATQRTAAQLPPLQTRGSITLTDYRGNKQTLNEVVYVPDCSEQILSLV